MIAARSYSACEASILAAHGTFDNIFESNVETAPRLFSISQRPKTKERQDNVFISYNYSSSTNFENQKEHTASTVIINHIQTIASWIDSFSGIKRLSTNNASLSASGTSEELTQTEASLWYREFEYLSISKNTRDALDLLFSQVEEAFDVSDFHKLDCMLRKINTKVLPSEMLVSVLRATSRAKTSLASWQALLASAKNLAAQETLPSRMLRGL